MFYELILNRDPIASIQISDDLGEIVSAQGTPAINLDLGGII